MYNYGKEKQCVSVLPSKYKILLFFVSFVLYKLPSHCNNSFPKNNYEYKAFFREVTNNEREIRNVNPASTAPTLREMILSTPTCYACHVLWRSLETFFWNDMHSHAYGISLKLKSLKAAMPREISWLFDKSRNEWSLLINYNGEKIIE